MIGLGPMRRYAQMFALQAWGVAQGLVLLMLDGQMPADDLYMFMLEDTRNGAIRGTCQVFGQVGNDRPFYSYLISTLTQKSAELGRIFRNQALTLTTDLEGSSEVGSLFLHPQERAGGLAVADAVVRTCATAGRTVAFSGVTVAVSLCGLLVLDDPTFRSMGAAGIAVVLVAVAAALTLTPALLALLANMEDRLGLINVLVTRETGHTKQAQDE